MNLPILLPDGTGRARIHWFVHDPEGRKTPERIVQTAMGPIRLGGVTGKIACKPLYDGEFSVVALRGQFSDEVRAVNCPECQATAEYAKACGELKDLLMATEQKRTWADVEKETPEAKMAVPAAAVDNLPWHLKKG